MDACSHQERGGIMKNQRDLAADLKLCESLPTDPWVRVIAPGMSYSTLGVMHNGRPYPLQDDAAWSFIEAARDGWPQALGRAMEAETRVKELESQVSALNQTLGYARWLLRRAGLEEQLNPYSTPHAEGVTPSTGRTFQDNVQELVDAARFLAEVCSPDHGASHTLAKQQSDQGPVWRCLMPGCGLCRGASLVKRAIAALDPADS